MVKLVMSLENIINNESVLLDVLKSELSEIQERYGEKRKTEIIHEDILEKVDVKDILIEDYNCRIFYTNKYIKKHLKQSDNHKYVEDNMVLGDITSNNKDTLLIFTNKANRFKIQCSDLEQYQPSAYGTFIPSLFKLDSDEEVIKIVSIEKSVGYIICSYENGKVAKIKIDKYLSNYQKLENCYSTESRLLDIYYTEKDIDILMISNEGKGIIFNSGDINAVSSKNSQGSVGMKLTDDNLKVIGSIIGVADIINFELQTQKGKNKEFMLSDIATSSKKNEERTLYKYLYSKRANQGNFLLNLRGTKDKIINFKIKGVNNEK
jgi:DNA gyrase/topoisomerase IV subunit A